MQSSAQEAADKKPDDAQSVEQEDSNSMDIDNASGNREDEMTQMMNMMGLKNTSNGFVGKGGRNNKNRKRNNQGKSASGNLGRNRKAPS